jgi:hypothetical protein
MSDVKVNICRAESFPIRRVLHCPTCKRRRRFSGRDATWYGVTWTCCACGESFGDGERLARPFKPGWRAEARAAARAVWDEAGGYTRTQHRAWVMGQLGWREYQQKGNHQ